MKNSNFLSAIFQYISDTINSAERSFLDLLSAAVPYAVPVIPAYLTFFHTRDMMQFPDWVAATAAFVVEVLGITSVATAIRFQRHNMINKDLKTKAPFALAIATYIFYILVVLSVNVLLEVVTGERSGAVIWAIALFSLLSLPSAVLISIRAQYAEILDEKAERRAERKAAKRQWRPAFGKDVKLVEMEAGPDAEDAKFRKL